MAGSTHTLLLTLELQMCTIVCGFTWIPGIHTEVLTFMQQVIYPLDYVPMLCLHF